MLCRGEGTLLTAPCHEHGVHVVQRRVLLLVHDIPGRDMELASVEANAMRAGSEESCEDAAVAAVLGAGVREGGVAFEDGDAEGH